MTTWYYSTNGNDSNDGLTLATAWRNPGVNSSSIQAGDTVLIDDGAYNRGHDTSMIWECAGTKANPITVKAINNGQVELQAYSLVSSLTATWVSYKGGNANTWSSTDFPDDAGWGSNANLRSHYGFFHTNGYIYGTNSAGDNTATDEDTLEPGAAFYDSATNTMYIRTVDELQPDLDPNLRHTQIAIFRSNGADAIVFDGLKFTFGMRGFGTDAILGDTEPSLGHSVVRCSFNYISEAAMNPMPGVWSVEKSWIGRVGANSLGHGMYTRSNNDGNNVIRNNVLGYRYAVGRTEDGSTVGGPNGYGLQVFPANVGDIGNNVVEDNLFGSWGSTNVSSGPRGHLVFQTDSTSGNSIKNCNFWGGVNNDFPSLPSLAVTAIALREENVVVEDCGFYYVRLGLFSSDANGSGSSMSRIKLYASAMYVNTGYGMTFDDFFVWYQDSVTGTPTYKWVFDDTEINNGDWRIDVREWQSDTGSTNFRLAQDETDTPPESWEQLVLKATGLDPDHGYYHWWPYEPKTSDVR